MNCWMVFVLGIISIAALGVTDYHAREAQEDYYDPSRSGERPGFFIGRGARLLRLIGDISRQQHGRLIRGFYPTTGGALRKSAGRKHQATAFDIALSAAKSFSVCWAISDDPTTRQKLEKAFLIAVRRTVRRVERATFTRVGRRGEPVPAWPVIGCYVHTTSRAGDPQLHAHLVVFNLGVRPDGKTGAILSRPFFLRKMAWGALFRCDLNRVLQREFPRLGFSHVSVGPEIDIPRDVLNHFSKRRRDMEASAPTFQTLTAAAKALVCLKTRPKKPPAFPLAERLKTWRQEAQHLAFGPEQVAALLQRDTPTPVHKSRVLQGAFHSAVRELSHRQSHFSDLDLLRYTAQSAAGKGVSGCEVERWLDRKLERCPELAPLGKISGHTRYTTPEILTQEKNLLARTAQLATQPSHQITTLGLTARLSLQNVAAVRQWWLLNRDRSLNHEQRRVIHSTARRSGRVALITGGAGTPRQQTLARLAQFYQAAGYAVLTAAPSQRGADRLANLADAGGISLPALLHLADRDCSPTAAAKHAAKQLVRQAVGRRIGLYPYRRRPLLEAKTVVIVDQAQRISTPDMERLVKHIERSGAKLILAGNVDGLQSIERGVPFASLARKFPTAKLTEITGPRHAADARNLKRLTEGRSRELLTDLAQRGRLHVAPTPASAMDRLVKDWRQAGGAHDPKRHLILVGSREEMRQVNDLASQHRRASQSNGKAESVILPGGEKLFTGDRVVCTRTSRRYQVASGELGTVTGCSRRAQLVHISFDSGREASLPLATYPHLTRGYAMTVHQALPADNVYLLLSGGCQDRQTALAMFSQASGRTRVYTDYQTAGRELKRLVRQLASDRKKSLALDIAQPTPTPRNERAP